MNQVIRLGEWITDTDGRTERALTVLAAVRRITEVVHYVLMVCGVLWLWERL